MASGRELALRIELSVRAHFNFSRLKDMSHASNLRTDRLQLFFDMLVSAIHVVNAIEDGFAVGDKCGEDKGG